MKTMKKQLAILSLVTAAVFANSAQAQGHASAASAASTLPVASVVSGASAVATVPVVLSAAGTVLVVKGAEASARGTVYLLERASDGARVSVEVAGGASVAAGTLVTVSVMGAGVVLSAAGEAIAFIPNAMGQALLHNERITN
jgi:hypothetical protein